MNAADVLRRLEAFAAGKPLPRGERKQVHLATDRDVLVVAFVRMGGESRPWGIAHGYPGKSPTVLSVPDARNRDRVARMVARFAPVLLRHLRSPSDVPEPPEGPNDLHPVRQVWLPNGAHLDMFHHLAYAYTFAKTHPEGVELELLNRFGRACGWLFREAQRPGQMAVMVAPKVLKEAYTFPAEDVRQAHLGYLMAWLETSGKLEKRLAAATEAERQSIATSLDPDIERDPLARAVEQWNEAEKAGSPGPSRKLESEIAGTLRAELQRRWELTVRALTWLRRDGRRENAGVTELLRDTAVEQWWRFVRPERIQAGLDEGQPYVPGNETDRHPVTAAAGYFAHQAAADVASSRLVHDDRELLAEAIARGDAFRGKLVSVADEGSGRTTRPVWRITDAAERQLRLRPESDVVPVGNPRQRGVIRSIEEDRSGSMVIEVEITGGKTLTTGPGLAPTDPELEGCEMAFVGAPADGISRRKVKKIRQKDGPGGWLTHSVPGGGTGGLADDDVDDAVATMPAEDD